MSHDANHDASAEPAPVLHALREAARSCTACPLWQHATQTVFGEGNPRARMVMVGEQPGDAEDIDGHPFIGPAGAILNQALIAAGLEREQLFVTNAVKHFKWEPRGRRRMHKTPAQAEIAACHRWLDAELAAIRPALVVCLGATATKALLGATQTLAKLRGRVIDRPDAPALLVTVHPSYVLRVPPQARDASFQGLVHDLTIAARFVADTQPRVT